VQPHWRSAAAGRKKIHWVVSVKGVVGAANRSSSVCRTDPASAARIRAKRGSRLLQAVS